MTTKQITPEEIADKKVASLPTYPTASGIYGGAGLSASEMKAAFDALPLYIVEKFNSLLNDIKALGNGSLASEIPTGLAEGHSLSELFSDIENGNFSSYLMIDGESLAEVISRLRERCGL